MDLAPAAMTGFLDWLRGTNDPPAEPLPGEWVSFLREHCAHYRRLPDVLQPTFEGCVQRFVTTKRITGVKVEADDDLRLLVAASAATLSLRWPGYKWSEVTEVLLYPDAFDRDFTIGNREIAAWPTGGERSFSPFPLCGTASTIRTSHTTSASMSSPIC